MRFIGIGLVSVAIYALGMSTFSAEAQVTRGAGSHRGGESRRRYRVCTTFDILCNGQIPPGQPAGRAVPERAR